MLFAALAALAILPFCIYLGLGLESSFRWSRLKLPSLAFWAGYFALCCLMFYFDAVISLLFGAYTVALYTAFRILRGICWLLAFHRGRQIEEKGEAPARRGVPDAFLAVLASACLLAYGAWNAGQITVKEYTLSVAGSALGRGGADILFISDVHAGFCMPIERLREAVSLANAQNADIIVLGGDTFDRSASEADIERAFQELKGLQAPYGVYWIPGNHDYKTDPYRFVMAGITPLVDEAALVDNSMYIVGRQDIDTGGRLLLAEIAAAAGRGMPAIVFDHQPSGAYEAASTGMAMQVSGHTHAGQIFPVGLLIDAFSGLNYGLKEVGDMPVVISSGMGTSFCPIRIGSHSEMALIHLNFLGLWAEGRNEL